MRTNPPRRHTLADHRFGHDADHVHDGDADHEHDPLAMDDVGPEGAGAASLVSIGIDVGSSGTQVVFVRMRLDAGGRPAASTVLHRSPVALTPFADAERIDADRVAGIVDGAFADAGLHPDDVDTGLVLLTGAALRRANAEALATALAATAGDVVCAAAGHHFEATIAAHGSGAVRTSRDWAGRVLALDVGGGTAKLALVEDGTVTATAALEVGGRLAVVDARDRLVRLDPAGALHARRAGLDWAVGSHAPPADLDRMAATMADALVAALAVRPLPPAVAALFVTDPFDVTGPLDGIVVSGGVGEYVYGRERRDFRDLGLRLGRALRARFDDRSIPWPLLPADACIRATAVGASRHGVQLSGRTGHLGDPTRLPLRGLRVIRLPDFADDADAFAAAIGAHLVRRDAADAAGDLAFALGWSGEPSHGRIAACAAGLARALASRLGRGEPLVLLLDGDVAGTLGAVLAEEVGVRAPILALDGLALRDFDVVDVGRLRLPSWTVPVTFRSLVFRERPPPGRRGHRRHHHHAAAR